MYLRCEIIEWILVFTRIIMRHYYSVIREIVFDLEMNNDSYLLGHVLHTTMTLCTQTCCINGQLNQRDYVNNLSKLSVMVIILNFRHIISIKTDFTRINLI